MLLDNSDELEDETDTESCHSDTCSECDDIISPDWEPLEFDEGDTGMNINPLTVQRL